MIAKPCSHWPLHFEGSCGEEGTYHRFGVLSRKTLGEGSHATLVAQGAGSRQHDWSLPVPASPAMDGIMNCRPLESPEAHGSILWQRPLWIVQNGLDQLPLGSDDAGGGDVLTIGVS